MGSILAEGTSLSALKPNIENLIRVGEKFSVVMTSSAPITSAQLDQVRSLFMEHGVAADVSASNNLLTITMTKPESDGIGFIPLLVPILAVGGIITAVLGWKLLSMDPMDYLIKSLPFIALGVGAILLYKYAKN